MTDAKETIRRIERGQERDWRREYARLLPPVPAPTRTPDCTCDWVEERLLCVAESTYSHTRYGLPVRLVTTCTVSFGWH